MDDEFVEGVEKKETTSSKVLSDITVLVIDDNPINLIVAEKTLSKFGANSIKALSAKEGIQKFSTGSINLVLMDLHMPGIDGYKATKLLHETEQFKNSPVPVLAYTTFAYDEVKEKVEAHKLDGYIGKPFTQGQVFETIMSVLSIKPDTKQA
ncbi:response regulator [Fabibacter sp. E12]|nr:response regulator [Roseivirga sp. E12]